MKGIGIHSKHYPFLIYQKHRQYNSVRIIGVFFLLLVLVYFICKRTLKTYDYVIYGGGKLTKIIAYFMSQKYDVLLVTPENKIQEVYPIIGSDINVISDNSNFYDESFCYFPSQRSIDIQRLRNQIDIDEKALLNLERELFTICGERYKNCYMFFFDDKITKCEKIEVPGMDRIINDINKNIRIFFQNQYFVRSKKIIFGESGLHCLLKMLWDRKSVLDMSMMISISKNIVKTKAISFLHEIYKNRLVDIFVNNDTVSFSTVVEFAKGFPYAWKCVYDNDSLDTLLEVSKKTIDLLDVDYSIYPKPLGIKNLVHNFRHKHDKRIICLDPAVFQPHYHWVRDFLIMCLYLQKTG